MAVASAQFISFDRTEMGRDVYFRNTPNMAHCDVINGSSCFDMLQRELSEMTYWVVHLIEQLLSLLHCKGGEALKHRQGKKERSRNTALAQQI